MAETKGIAKVHVLSTEREVCLSILGEPNVSPTNPDWPSVIISQAEARQLINMLERMESGWVKA